MCGNGEKPCGVRLAPQRCFEANRRLRRLLGRDIPYAVPSVKALKLRSFGAFSFCFWALQKQKTAWVYHPLKNNLDEIVEDAHQLAFKHEVRADAINMKEFHYDDKHVHGLLFDIKGDAASSMQFCVTDSTKNFVRGALYFNVPPNKDSLAPVIDFVREDIIEMISSFEWRETK